MVLLTNFEANEDELPLLYRLPALILCCIVILLSFGIYHCIITCKIPIFNDNCGIDKELRILSRKLMIDVILFLFFQDRKAIIRW